MEVNHVAAVQLAGFLAKHCDQEFPLEKLAEHFGIRPMDLITVVAKYSCMFQNAKVDGQVGVRLDAWPKICFGAGFAGKTADCVACDGLHLCTDFLLGMCNDSSRCSSNHAFRSEVEPSSATVDSFTDAAKNQKILQKLGLIDWPADVLRSLVNTIEVNLPLPSDVCARYNSNDGTSCGSECPDYHCCEEFFLSKSCLSGPACKKSHGIVQEKTYAEVVAKIGSRNAEAILNQRETFHARVMFRKLLSTSRFAVIDDSSPPLIVPSLGACCDPVAVKSILQTPQGPQSSSSGDVLPMSDHGFAKASDDEDNSKHHGASREELCWICADSHLPGGTTYLENLFLAIGKGPDNPDDTMLRDIFQLPRFVYDVVRARLQAVESTMPGPSGGDARVSQAVRALIQILENLLRKYDVFSGQMRPSTATGGLEQSADPMDSDEMHQFLLLAAVALTSCVKCSRSTLDILENWRKLEELMWRLEAYAAFCQQRGISPCFCWDRSKFLQMLPMPSMPAVPGFVMGTVFPASLSSSVMAGCVLLRLPATASVPPPGGIPQRMHSDSGSSSSSDDDDCRKLTKRKHGGLPWDHDAKPCRLFPLNPFASFRIVTRLPLARPLPRLSTASIHAHFGTQEADFSQPNPWGSHTSVIMWHVKEPRAGSVHSLFPTWAVLLEAAFSRGEEETVLPEVDPVELVQFVERYPTSKFGEDAFDARNVRVMYQLTHVQIFRVLYTIGREVRPVSVNFDQLNGEGMAWFYKDGEEWKLLTGTFNKMTFGLGASFMIDAAVVAHPEAVIFKLESFGLTGYTVYPLQKKMISPDGKTWEIKKKEVDMEPGAGRHWLPMIKDGPHFAEAILVPVSVAHFRAECGAQIPEKAQDNAGFMLSVNIVQVWRIQNPACFQRFEQCYQELQDVYCKEDADANTVVMSLFHGTSANAVAGICHEGFDPTRAGENVGTLLGCGTYFSKNFELSHFYACEAIPTPTSADRVGTRRFMFVSSVLVGQVTQGSPGMTSLPFWKGKIQFDTAVDIVSTPTVFVKLDGAQSYPRFLMEYEVHQARPDDEVDPGFCWPRMGLSL